MFLNLLIPRKVQLTCRKTWEQKVENYDTTGYTGGPDNPQWERIVKLTLRESNAAAHPEEVHPDLYLRPPTDEEEAAAEEEAEARESGTQRKNAVCKLFAKLDIKIIVRILDYALFFPGQVVHVLSRLDPYRAPDGISDDPAEPDPRILRRSPQGIVQLPKRFHIGKAPVCVTFALRPEVLLAPLKICRQWCFIGTHIFYGKNTFAFSSLGE